MNNHIGRNDDYDYYNYYNYYNYIDHQNCCYPKNKTNKHRYMNKEECEKSSCESQSDSYSDMVNNFDDETFEHYLKSSSDCSLCNFQSNPSRYVSNYQYPLVIDKKSQTTDHIEKLFSQKPFFKNNKLKINLGQGQCDDNCFSIIGICKNIFRFLLLNLSSFHISMGFVCMPLFFYFFTEFAFVIPFFVMVVINIYLLAFLERIVF